MNNFAAIDFETANNERTRNLRLDCEDDSMT
jgi:hypothetical protein